MSHRDSKRNCLRLNSACLKLAIGWLLRGIDWSGIRFREDCSWTPRLLAATGLLWSFSDENTLVDRFRAVCRIILHLFPEQEQLAGSYQAFTKMLRRWTDELIALVQVALRERMQQDLHFCWEVSGFVLFGVDGSRVELPRTRSHEKVYAPARKRSKSKAGRRKSRSAASQKKASLPNMWLTTMWHAGSGLPWDWRIGPSDSSERAHLLAMLSTLPANALVAADAGFVGYAYAKAIIDSQRHLLVRVGSNVRLLKKLGYVRESAGTVYLWPDQQARRQQPPIVLRLVVSHNGKHPMYLLTSVLSTSKMTDRQIIEFYARRWGIEVYYRHLKQTFGRRKLRSTSAENARVEMQWSLAGLWAMACYALVQIGKQKIPPKRLSIAQTLRAFRRTLRDYLHPAEHGHSLRTQLQTALIDPYHRKNKTSRNYPRKKQETPPGPPKITNATKTQIKLAEKSTHAIKAKGLTA